MNHAKIMHWLFVSLIKLSISSVIKIITPETCKTPLKKKKRIRKFTDFFDMYFISIKNQISYESKNNCQFHFMLDIQILSQIQKNLIVT